MNAVFAVMPANADPLLLAAEVNAYRISLKPCASGSWFQIVTFETDRTNVAMASPIMTVAGITRM